MHHNMTFIEDYRKILQRMIKDYHWNDIQIEIESFFNEIKRANIPRQECLKKFIISESGILEKFSLTQEKLKDPIYLDRIYDLLEYMKEINFECFPNTWFTYKYHHHDHGYKIKSLLDAIEDVVEELIKFKADKFDLLVEVYHKEEDFQVIEKFIDLNFQDYGLLDYDSYVNLINGIAYHDDLFVLLPNLLRCLFENLVRDIIANSLNDKHKDLYYDKHKSRIREFSILINLLNILRKNEYKPYIGDKIFDDMIEDLEKLRYYGNLSIHDVTKKITVSFIYEWKEKISLILEALLISYSKINFLNIELAPQRNLELKLKLGIIRKKDSEKLKKKLKKRKYKK